MLCLFWQTSAVFCRAAWVSQEFHKSSFMNAASKLVKRLNTGLAVYPLYDLALVRGW
jgi:hypothetical protein